MAVVILSLFVSADALSPKKIRSADPGWVYLIEPSPTRLMSLYPPLGEIHSVTGASGNATTGITHSSSAKVTPDSTAAAASAPTNTIILPSQITIYGDNFDAPGYTLSTITVVGLACTNYTFVRNGTGAVVGAKCTLQPSSVPAAVRATLASTGITIGDIAMSWTGATPKQLTLPRSFPLYSPSVSALVPPAAEASGESPIRVKWQGVHRTHFPRISITLAGVPTTVLRASSGYVVVRPAVAPGSLDKGDVVVSLLPEPEPAPETGPDSDSQNEEDKVQVTGPDTTLTPTPDTGSDSGADAGDDAVSMASGDDMGSTDDVMVLTTLASAFTFTNAGALQNPVVQKVEPSWAFAIAQTVASSSSSSSSSSSPSSSSSSSSPSLPSAIATPLPTTLRLTGRALHTVEKVGVNGLTCENVVVVPDETDEDLYILVCTLPVCYFDGGAADNLAVSGSAGSAAAGDCLGPGWIGLYDDHQQIGYSGFEYVKQPSFDGVNPGTDIPFARDTTVTLTLTNFNPSVPFALTVVDVDVPDTQTIVYSANPWFVRFTLPACTTCTDPIRGGVTVFDAARRSPGLILSVEITRVPNPPPNVFSISPSSIELGDTGHVVTFFGESLLEVGAVRVTVNVPERALSYNGQSAVVGQPSDAEPEQQLPSGPFATLAAASLWPGRDRRTRRPPTQSVAFVVAPDIPITDSKMTGSFPFCGETELACLPGAYALEIYDHSGALVARTQTQIVLQYNPATAVQVQLVFNTHRENYSDIDSFFNRLSTVVKKMYPGPQPEVSAIIPHDNTDPNSETGTEAGAGEGSASQREGEIDEHADNNIIIDFADEPKSLDIRPRVAFKWSATWGSALRGSDTTRVIVQLLPAARNAPPAPMAGYTALMNAVRSADSELRQEFPGLNAERTIAQAAITTQRCSLNTYQINCGMTAAEEDTVDESCDDCEPQTPDPGNDDDDETLWRTLFIVFIVLVVGGAIVGVAVLRARSSSRRAADASRSQLLEDDDVEREFKAMDAAHMSVGRSFAESNNGIN